MSAQVLTVKEYAEKRNVSKPAVTKAMKAGKKLIGVQFYHKIGRDWLLTVNNPLTKKNKGTCVA